MAKQQRCLSEHEEQCLFVQWMELQFPSVRFFAIPNGGYRAKLIAVKLKREGVRAGVPDVYVPAWKLWIEFKPEKGGKVTPVQKEWKEYLEGIGDTHFVARGFNDAKQKVIQFLDSL